MGTLYVVATPIGNLEDITLRALRILKEVDLIACEDTRVTKRLLDRYQITKPLISYHQHSRVGKISFIVENLKSGKNVALVSDAGTPGICDPGQLLVKAAIQERIKVEPIPGASALATAISVSGIATDRFLFLGFLPHKKGRQTMLAEIKNLNYPVVLYESVHRIQKLLNELADCTKQIILLREVTKVFETVYRGSSQEILRQLTDEQIKGEFIVIIEGK